MVSYVFSGAVEQVASVHQSTTSDFALKLFYFETPHRKSHVILVSWRWFGDWSSSPAFLLSLSKAWPIETEKERGGGTDRERGREETQIIIHNRVGLYEPRSRHTPDAPTRSGHGEKNRVETAAVELQHRFKKGQQKKTWFPILYWRDSALRSPCSSALSTTRLDIFFFNEDLQDGWWQLAPTRTEKRRPL